MTVFNTRPIMFSEIADSLLGFFESEFFYKINTTSDVQRDDLSLLCEEGLAFFIKTLFDEILEDNFLFADAFTDDEALKINISWKEERSVSEKTRENLDKIAKNSAFDVLFGEKLVCLIFTNYEAKAITVYAKQTKNLSRYLKHAFFT